MTQVYNIGYKTLILTVESLKVGHQDEFAYDLLSSNQQRNGYQVLSSTAYCQHQTISPLKKIFEQKLTPIVFC